MSKQLNLEAFRKQVQEAVESLRRSTTDLANTNTGNTGPTISPKRMQTYYERSKFYHNESADLTTLPLETPENIGPNKIVSSIENEVEQPVQELTEEQIYKGLEENYKKRAEKNTPATGFEGLLSYVGKLAEGVWNTVKESPAGSIIGGVPELIDKGINLETVTNLIPIKRAYNQSKGLIENLYGKGKEFVEPLTDPVSAEHEEQKIVQAYKQQTKYVYDEFAKFALTPEGKEWMQRNNTKWGMTSDNFKTFLDNNLSTPEKRDKFIKTNRDISTGKVISSFGQGLTQDATTLYKQYFESVPEEFDKLPKNLQHAWQDLTEIKLDYAKDDFWGKVLIEGSKSLGMLPWLLTGTKAAPTGYITKKKLTPELVNKGFKEGAIWTDAKTGLNFQLTKEVGKAKLKDIKLAMIGSAKWNMPAAINRSAMEMEKLEREGIETTPFDAAFSLTKNTIQNAIEGGTEIIGAQYISPVMTKMGFNSGINALLKLTPLRRSEVMRKATANFFTFMTAEQVEETMEEEISNIPDYTSMVFQGKSFGDILSQMGENIKLEYMISLGMGATMGANRMWHQYRAKVLPEEVQQKFLNLSDRILGSKKLEKWYETAPEKVIQALADAGSIFAEKSMEQYSEEVEKLKKNSTKKVAEKYIITGPGSETINPIINSMFADIEQGNDIKGSDIVLLTDIAINPGESKELRDAATAVITNITQLQNLSQTSGQLKKTMKTVTLMYSVDSVLPDELKELSFEEKIQFMIATSTKIPYEKKLRSIIALKKKGVKLDDYMEKESPIAKAAEKEIIKEKEKQTSPDAYIRDAVDNSISVSSKNKINIDDATTAIQEKVIQKKYSVLKGLPQAEFSKVISRMSTDDLIEMQSVIEDKVKKDILDKTLQDKLSTGSFTDLTMEDNVIDDNFVDDFAGIFSPDDKTDIILVTPEERAAKLVVKTPEIAQETGIDFSEDIAPEEIVVPEEIVSQIASNEAEITTVEDFSKKKKAELVNLAKEANILGYSKMNKAQLIEALQPKVIADEPFEEVSESSSEDDLMFGTVNPNNYNPFDKVGKELTPAELFNELIDKEVYDLNDAGFLSLAIFLGQQITKQGTKVRYATPEEIIKEFKVKKDGTRAAAFHRGADNTIWIDPNISYDKLTFRVMLHESLHAITRYDYDNNKEFRGDVDRILDRVRKEMGWTKKNGVEIGRQVGGRVITANEKELLDYHLDNPYEFLVSLSRTTTLPAYMLEMKSTIPGVAKGNSMWDDFIEALKRVFEHYNASGTVLDELNMILNQHIRAEYHFNGDDLMIPKMKRDDRKLSSAQVDALYGTVDGKIDKKGSKLAEHFYDPMWNLAQHFMNTALNIGPGTTIDQLKENLSQYFLDDEINLMVKVQNSMKYKTAPRLFEAISKYVEGTMQPDLSTAEGKDFQELIEILEAQSYDLFMEVAINEITFQTEDESAPFENQIKQENVPTEGHAINGATIKFTDGQIAAMKELQQIVREGKQQYFAIWGYAGAGKTTVMRAIKGMFPNKRMLFTAPTNKAAKVLRRATGTNAITIHKALKLKLKEGFGASILEMLGFEDKPFKENDIVVIDEASMLDQNILDHISKDLKPGQLVVFVGDPAQLPPVGLNASPVFGEEQKDIGSGKLSADFIPSEAVLTEVVRTGKESPILAIVTGLRNALRYFTPQTNKGNYFNANSGVGKTRFFKKGGEAFKASFMEKFKSEEFKNNPDYVRVMAFTNAKVLELNRIIRRELFGENVADYLPGEVLTFDKPYTIDENIIFDNGDEAKIISISKPIKKIFRGKWLDIKTIAADLEVDLYEVELESISTGQGMNITIPSPESYQKLAGKRKWKAEWNESPIGWFDYIKDQTWKQNLAGRRDALESYLGMVNSIGHVRHSYAITVHKSQGSTFNHAYVMDNDIQSFGNRAVFPQSDKRGSQAQWNDRKSVVHRNRMRYTAFSRASESLNVYVEENVPIKDTAPPQKQIAEKKIEQPKTVIEIDIPEASTPVKKSLGTGGVKKIISGGQNGTDKGALLAAESLNIETGGTAPKGFRTTAGADTELGTRFGLVPDTTENYDSRTRLNVANADATLVIKRIVSPGTENTIKYAKESKKPYHVVDLIKLNEEVSKLPKAEQPARRLELIEREIQLAQDFLMNNKIEILNVAGHRDASIDSQQKGVKGMQAYAQTFLTKVFDPNYTPVVNKETVPLTELKQEETEQKTVEVEAKKTIIHLDEDASSTTSEEDKFDPDEILEFLESKQLDGVSIKAVRALALLMAKALNKTIKGNDYYSFIQSMSWGMFKEQFDDNPIIEERLKAYHNLFYKYKITDYDVFKKKIIRQTWNKIKGLKKYDFVTFDIEREQFNGMDTFKLKIKKEGFEFINPKGGRRNSYQRARLFDTYVEKITDILGLPPGSLSVAMINGVRDLDTGQTTSIHQSTINQRTLATSAYGQGYIYLNVFGEKNTAMMLHYNGKVADGQWLTEKGEKINLTRVIDGYYKALAKSYENVQVEHSESGKLSLAVRAMLEDLKLGNTVKNIKQNKSLILNTNLAELFKRPWFASETSYMEEDKVITDFVENTELPGVSIELDASGKKVVMINCVSVDTKNLEGIMIGEKEVSPSFLLNELGINSLDGASHYVFGVFDTLWNLAQGVIKPGKIKNWVGSASREDEISYYFKHALHGLVQKDRYGQWLINNNVAIAFNDTTNKYSKNIPKTTLAEMQNGKAKTFKIPLKEFYRIKEHGDPSRTTKGLMQIFHSSGIFPNNKALESVKKGSSQKLIKAVGKIVENHTDIAGRKMTEETNNIEKIIKHFRELALRATSGAEKIFSDILERTGFLESGDLEEKMQGLLGHGFVSEVLKSKTKSLLDRIIKYQVPGTLATLGPDHGILSESRIKAIEQSIMWQLVSEADNAVFTKAVPNKTKRDLIKDVLSLTRELDKIESQYATDDELTQGDIIQLDKVKQRAEDRLQLKKTELMVLQNNFIKETNIKRKAEGKPLLEYKTLNSSVISYINREKIQPEIDKRLETIVNPDTGRLKPGWCMISKDIANMHGLKAGDTIMTTITPSDSLMGLGVHRIAAILPSPKMGTDIKNVMTENNSVILNSEYVQGVGKDFDIDVVGIIPVSDVITPDIFSDMEKIVGNLSEHYLKEMFNGMNEFFGRQHLPLMDNVNDALNLDYRLKFMRALMGKVGTDENMAGFTTVGLDAWELGDNMEKPIGEVVNERTQHNMLTSIGFKTTVNKKKYNFNHGDNFLIHIAHLIMTNDYVDFPKNMNKKYYANDPYRRMALMAGIYSYDKETGQIIIPKTAMADLQAFTEIIQFLLQDAIYVSKEFNRDRSEARRLEHSIGYIQRAKEIVDLLREGNGDELYTRYMNVVKTNAESWYQEEKKAQAYIKSREKVAKDFFTNMEIDNVDNYALFKLLNTIPPVTIHSHPKNVHRKIDNEVVQEMFDQYISNVSFPGMSGTAGTERSKLENDKRISKKMKDLDSQDDYIASLDDLLRKVDYYKRPKWNKTDTADWQNSLMKLRMDLINLVQAYDDKTTTQTDTAEMFSASKESIFPLLMQALIKNSVIDYAVKYDYKNSKTFSRTYKIGENVMLMVRNPRNELYFVLTNTANYEKYKTSYQGSQLIQEVLNNSETVIQSTDLAQDQSKEAEIIKNFLWGPSNIFKNKKIREEFSEFIRFGSQKNVPTEERKAIAVKYLKERLDKFTPEELQLNFIYLMGYPSKYIRALMNLMFNYDNKFDTLYKTNDVLMDIMSQVFPYMVRDYLNHYSRISGVMGISPTEDIILVAKSENGFGEIPNDLGMPTITAKKTDEGVSKHYTRISELIRAKYGNRIPIERSLIKEIYYFYKVAKESPKEAFDYLKTYVAQIDLLRGVAPTDYNLQNVMSDIARLSADEFNKKYESLDLDKEFVNLYELAGKHIDIKHNQFRGDRPVANLIVILWDLARIKNSYLKSKRNPVMKKITDLMNIDHFAINHGIKNYSFSTNSNLYESINLNTVQNTPRFITGKLIQQWLHIMPNRVDNMNFGDVELHSFAAQQLWEQLDELEVKLMNQINAVITAERNVATNVLQDNDIALDNTIDTAVAIRTMIWNVAENKTLDKSGVKDLGIVITRDNNQYVYSRNGEFFTDPEALATRVYPPLKKGDVSDKNLMHREVLIGALAFRRMYDIEVPLAFENARAFMQRRYAELIAKKDYTAARYIGSILYRYSKMEEKIKALHGTYMPHNFYADDYREIFRRRYFKVWYDTLKLKRLKEQEKRSKGQVYREEVANATDDELRKIVEDTIENKLSEAMENGIGSTFNPHTLERKFPDAEGYIKGIHTPHLEYIRTLRRSLLNDLTFTNYLMYRNSAINNGENSYVFDTMKQWFKNQAGYKLMHTKMIPISELRKGMEIEVMYKGIVKTQFGDVVQEQTTFGKIQKIEDNKIHFESRSGKKVIFDTDQIYTRDDRNKEAKGQVRRYVRDGMVEKLVQNAKEVGMEDTAPGKWKLIKGANVVLNGMDDALSMTLLGGLGQGPATTVNMIGGLLQNLKKAPIRTIKYGWKGHAVYKHMKETDWSKVDFKNNTLAQQDYLLNQALTQMSILNPVKILELAAQGEISVGDIGMDPSWIKSFGTVLRIWSDASGYSLHRERLEKLLMDLDVAEDAAVKMNIKQKILDENNRWTAEKQDFERRSMNVDHKFVKQFLAKLQSGEANLAEVLKIRKEEANVILRKFLGNSIKTASFKLFQKPEGMLRRMAFFIGYYEAVDAGFAPTDERALVAGKQRVKQMQKLYSPKDKQLGAAKSILGKIGYKFAQYSYTSFVTWRKMVPEAFRQVLKNGPRALNIFSNFIYERQPGKLWNPITERYEEVKGKEVATEVNVTRTIVNWLAADFTMMQLGTMFMGFDRFTDPMMHLFYNLGEMIAKLFDDDDEFDINDYETTEYIRDLTFFMGWGLKLPIEVAVTSSQDQADGNVAKGTWDTLTRNRSLRIFGQLWKAYVTRSETLSQSQIERMLTGVNVVAPGYGNDLRRLPLGQKTQILLSPDGLWFMLPGGINIYNLTH